MRMRRITIKTGIRAFAIALIAFPEPITTALGILVLSASCTMYRQKHISQFGDPETLIQKSLKNTEPTGFRRYLDRKQTDSNHVPAQYYSWFDNHRIVTNSLQHTIKTSYPQYQSKSSRIDVRSVPV
jgi:hypothetical protein